MRTVLVSAALLMTSVTAVSAQSKVTEGQAGFHASAGVGYGSVEVVCSGCGDNREGNLAGYLRFGGAINPSVVLSGQLTGWTKSRDGATMTATLAAFISQWYPKREGFYILGGLGVASIHETVNDPDLGAEEISTNSLGLQGGIGYDVAISPRFSLTPYFDVLYASGADAHLNGASTGFNVSGNMFHAGLALSFR